jgi:hypothetical protein
MNTVLGKKQKTRPKVYIIYTQQDYIQNNKISRLFAALFDLIRKRKILWRILG